MTDKNKENRFGISSSLDTQDWQTKYHLCFLWLQIKKPQRLFFENTRENKKELLVLLRYVITWYPVVLGIKTPLLIKTSLQIWNFKILIQKLFLLSLGSIVWLFSLRSLGFGKFLEGRLLLNVYWRMNFNQQTVELAWIWVKEDFLVEFWRIYWNL